MAKVFKSDAEWKKQLSPLQYKVTRRAATERPGTGEYAFHAEPGIYTCVCCNTPLFESDTKFDAGCGWPSYFKPIDQAHVHETLDTSNGMVRTRCAAAFVMHTWGTCSTTARLLPACATVSTRPP